MSALPITLQVLDSCFNEAVFGDSLLRLQCYRQTFHMLGRDLEVAVVFYAVILPPTFC